MIQNAELGGGVVVKVLGSDLALEQNGVREIDVVVVLGVVVLLASLNDHEIVVAEGAVVNLRVAGSGVAQVDKHIGGIAVVIDIADINVGAAALLQRDGRGVGQAGVDSDVLIAVEDDEHGLAVALDGLGGASGVLQEADAVTVDGLQGGGSNGAGVVGLSREAVGSVLDSGLVNSLQGVNTAVITAVGVPAIEIGLSIASGGISKLARAHDRIQLSSRQLSASFVGKLLHVNGAKLAGRGVQGSLDVGLQTAVGADILQVDEVAGSVGLINAEDVLAVGDQDNLVANSVAGILIVRFDLLGILVECTVDGHGVVLDELGDLTLERGRGLDSLEGIFLGGVGDDQIVVLLHAGDVEVILRNDVLDGTG